MVLINIVKKNWVDKNKYSSIKKGRNKMVEILIKSKSWNLL